jgi:hypothetical protein
LALARSQTISKFFRLYTLSISEWTFLSSRHLRIGRKGGEGLPERRALIGFGQNLNKYQRPRQLKRSHLVGGLRIFADDLTESNKRAADGQL